MSQWEEQFRSHAVHAILEQASSQAASAKEVAKDDSDALVQLARLTDTLSLARSRLAASDPGMSPIDPLSALQQHLQEILNQLNNYVSNQNVGHLTKANNHVEPLLVTLNTNYPPTSTLASEQIAEIISGLRGELERFSSASSEHLQRLTEKTQVLSTKTDEAVQELSAQRARLDEAINNFQQQFTQAEEARREQAQQTAGEYSEELERIKTARTDAFDEFKSKESSAVAELKKQIESSAQQVLNDLSAHRQQAEKLVHVIGNTGMVGGYQKFANESRDASRYWKIGTVASMLGLVGFAVFAFLLTKGTGEFDFGRFGARVFVAATFGIIAAYCARQSDRLDERERRSRKMELELASIDPYLADLQEDVQKQVKESLAPRFFGKDDEPKPSKVKATTGTAKDTTDLLRALADLLKARAE